MIEPSGEVHAIGCSVTADCFGIALPGFVDGSPRFNHWVIGVPMGGCIAGATSIGSIHLLRVVMAAAGLAVVETQALGDCGIDVLAHALALPRSASTFKKLRSQLASFMEFNADDPTWQDIWLACCEGAPVPLPPPLPPPHAPPQELALAEPSISPKEELPLALAELSISPQGHLPLALAELSGPSH